MQQVDLRLFKTFKTVLGIKIIRLVRIATKYVLLKNLKVGELKKELEERDVDTGGKKAELQQKLRHALTEVGEEPDKILFEVPGVVDMSAVLEKMEENSRSLKEQMKDNSRSLDGRKL